MNGFALTAFYRGLARHPLYAAINIGGLAVGIAVFLVLALYVRFETSYERWLPGHDQVYALETVWNLPGSPVNGRDIYTMGGLLDQLRQDFPSTVGTRIRGGEDGGTVLRDGVAFTDDVAQVDPSFFRVFDLPMLSGDGTAALASPTGAAISESAARRYFGDTDAIGRTIAVTEETTVAYRVAAVFHDLPANSDLKLSILIPLPRTVSQDGWSHWGSTSVRTFLRFPNGAAAHAYEERLPLFVDRHGFQDMGRNASSQQALKLVPIAAIHLTPQGTDHGSLRLAVITLGLVGVVTLLIAVVNYVNLATARAGLRARDVAMRKVLGASRAALITQFLGEAMLTSAVAALLGLALAEVALPLVNAAGGTTLDIPYAVVLPALIALSAVVGVAAGLYPAVLLSAFPAAAVLAAARAPGGGRAGTRVRETLVILQFGLAIAFMIGTAVLFAQARHVRTADLGFHRDGLIVLLSMRDSTISAGQRRTLATAIRALPDVTDVALGNGAAGGSGANNGDNVPLPGVAGDGPSLRWIVVGPHYFETYGAHLLAGRLFDDVHGGDATEDRAKGAPIMIMIVIDRSAVPVLGFRAPGQAIGKTVGGDRPRTIIGVIEDMRFTSPRITRGATYYMYDRRPEERSNAVATIRFRGDPRVTMDRVRALWQRMVPQVPFNADTANRRLALYYRSDARATRLFTIGAVLAVAIGCVGLWGLASFNTARRVKEIGIRKTLGASTGDVVRLLVGQFLRPVLIANLIAWPLAFAAMRTWLAGFEDRISLSPLFFVGASALALAIAVLTVLAQSLRAARATPAWALRHE